MYAKTDVDIVYTPLHQIKISPKFKVNKESSTLILNICVWKQAGFQIRNIFCPIQQFFYVNFFAQFWGPIDGPKARDGHHV